MKKISYIVLGGMLVFAACQPNNTQDAAKLQHTIDSTAMAAVQPEIDKLKKACDDEIMTAAQDSAKMIIEKAKKGVVRHVAPKPKPVVKKVEETKNTLSHRAGDENAVKNTLSKRAGEEATPNNGQKNTLSKRAGESK